MLVILVTGTCQWYVSVILVTSTCQWYVSVIIVIGTCHWYVSVILVTGTRPWYVSVILVTGTRPWCVSVIRVSGTCQWYMSVPFVFQCLLLLVCLTWTCLGQTADLEIPPEADCKFTRRTPVSRITVIPSSAQTVT